MKTLHASKAGFPCNRNIWYAVNGYEVEQGENRIFEIGDYLEPKIVEFLQRDGWEVFYNPGSQEAKIKLTYDLPDGQLVGHFDCFISKGNMQNILADIKTMNDRNFKFWKRDGSLKKYPKYVDQLHVYAGAAIQAGYTVEHLAIVGFNKNNSEMYIDIFDYSPERFEAICERSEQIFKSEVEPVEGCKRESWCCGYCDYWDICDMNEHYIKKDAPINEDIVVTDDEKIINAMAMLQEGRELGRAGAAMEAEAKAILEADVIKQGIRHIQGGSYALSIKEKPRTAFDATAFKKAHPEYVSQFMKTSTSIYYEVERLGEEHEY